MNTPYQMNYRTPVAENWNHIPLATPEAAEDVSSMLERLKAESTSLESYFSELESELKRVHLKRKVVGKKLGVLSDLVKDVEALRAEPSSEVQAAPFRPQMDAEVPPQRSRKKQLFVVASVVVVALAVAFIALEKTGQLSSCVSCAPAKLLGMM